MRIAILSGKGGTGKTTVAANLAAFLNNAGEKVTLVDCDVEEPNSHYFLPSTWEKEEEQFVPVPQIDQDNCLGESCQKCVQECRFKALIWMLNSIQVFPELCHSCGLCQYICPTQAVAETTRNIGRLREAHYKNVRIFGGLLRIGEAMAPPLISKVKEAAENSDIQLIDSPPGTSCPVIESLQGADFALLVAEPTPFGLYDLQLAVGLMKKLGYPFGVIINREGMGDQEMEKYLDQENITVLARLPHKQEAATAYSKGKLLIEEFPEFQRLFAELWDNLCNQIKKEKS